MGLMERFFVGTGAATVIMAGWKEVGRSMVTSNSDAEVGFERGENLRYS